MISSQLYTRDNLTLSNTVLSIKLYNVYKSVTMSHKLLQTVVVHVDSMSASHTTTQRVYHVETLHSSRIFVTAQNERTTDNQQTPTNKKNST